MGSRLSQGQSHVQWGGVWPCTPKAAGQDMERDQDRMWGLAGHWERAQGRALRECGEGPERDLNGDCGGKTRMGVQG